MSQPYTHQGVSGRRVLDDGVPGVVNKSGAVEGAKSILRTARTSNRVQVVRGAVSAPERIPGKERLVALGSAARQEKKGAALLASPLAAAALAAPPHKPVKKGLGVAPTLARKKPLVGTGALARVTGGTEPKRAIIGKGMRPVGRSIGLAHRAAAKEYGADADLIRHMDAEQDFANRSHRKSVDFVERFAYNPKTGVRDQQHKGLGLKTSPPRARSLTGQDKEYLGLPGGNGQGTRQGTSGQRGRVDYPFNGSKRVRKAFGGAVGDAIVGHYADKGRKLSETAAKEVREQSKASAAVRRRRAQLGATAAGSAGIGLGTGEVHGRKVHKGIRPVLPMSTPRGRRVLGAPLASKTAADNKKALLAREVKNTSDPVEKGAVFNQAAARAKNAERTLSQLKEREKPLPFERKRKVTKGIKEQLLRPRTLKNLSGKVKPAAKVVDRSRDDLISAGFSAGQSARRQATGGIPRVTGLHPGASLGSDPASERFAASQRARKAAIGKRAVYDPENRRRQRLGAATGAAAVGSTWAGKATVNEFRREQGKVAREHASLAERMLKPGISRVDKESIRAMVSRAPRITGKIAGKGAGATGLAATAVGLHRKSKHDRSWT